MSWIHSHHCHDLGSPGYAKRQFGTQRPGGRWSCGDLKHKVSQQQSRGFNYLILDLGTSFHKCYTAAQPAA